MEEIPETLQEEEKFEKYSKNADEFINYLNYNEK